jgi:hypothetical protein
MLFAATREVMRLTQQFTQLTGFRERIKVYSWNGLSDMKKLNTVC